MKNIAFIIDEFSPLDGGGFTLQSEILIELSKRNLERYDKKFFYNGKNNHLEKIIKNKKKIFYFKSNTIFDFLKIILKNFFPVRNWNTVLDSHLKKNDIDLAIFIGSSSYQINTKYIATCWDLMHLTHKHFKEFKNKKNWLIRYFNNKFTYKNAHKIIIGTQVGINDIVKFYSIPKKKLVKIPHPTPSFYLKNFQFDKRIIQGKYILYPAQFWEHKNHILLIEFMKIIKSIDFDLKLILVGSDKGELEVIKNKIDQFQLENHIYIKGFVEMNELANLYKYAHAMVYPSHCGPENLPPLEAMAMKCPAIVSDIPGHREQLMDAVLYFKPNDPMSLLDVLNFLENKENRLNFINKGFKRAQKFKIENYVDELINIPQ